VSTSFDSFATATANASIDILFVAHIMESDKKSSRVQNFSAEEVEFLVQTVFERLDVLESKKTDAKSLGMKKRAWDEVAHCFLENPCAMNRSREQLIDKWKTLKSVRH
jgi:hypothetical protein